MAEDDSKKKATEIEVTGTGPLAPKKAKFKEAGKKFKLVLIFEFDVTDEHDIQVEYSADNTTVKVSVNGECVQEWNVGSKVDSDGITKEIKKKKKVVVFLPKAEE